MIRLETPDTTQQQLQDHLAVTEALLKEAVSKLNRRDCDAEIIPLPDLGLPHNGLRASGGFFTGAVYRWESSIPFVPVDATVNVCGVSMFRSNVRLDSQAEFDEVVARTRARVEKETPYVWNLANGNHFIILADTDGGIDLPAGRYLILHASAAEFKQQYNGLYPTSSNWYADDVRVLPANGYRYLRYIHGKPAERFYALADQLVRYQETRQAMIAQIFCEESGAGLEQVLCRPHYGMPDSQSVAIGCQWIDGSVRSYPLLTRPEMPIYMVRPDPTSMTKFSSEVGELGVAPHGLGATAKDTRISYSAKGILIGDETFGPGTNISQSRSVGLRHLDLSEIHQKVLAQAPGEITATLHQTHSYYRKEGHHA